MTNKTRADIKAERFDYDHQAWIVDGVYVRCGHPDAMACACYGRLHAGERAADAVPRYYTTDEHCHY
jgi:hypothetical protein